MERKQYHPFCIGRRTSCAFFSLLLLCRAPWVKAAGPAGPAPARLQKAVCAKFGQPLLASHARMCLFFVIVIKMNSCFVEGARANIVNTRDRYLFQSLFTFFVMLSCAIVACVLQAQFMSLQHDCVYCLCSFVQ